jgi:hypothetical protein
MTSARSLSLILGLLTAALALDGALVRLGPANWRSASPPTGPLGLGVDETVLFQTSSAIVAFACIFALAAFCLVLSPLVLARPFLQTARAIGRVVRSASEPAVTPFNPPPSP